MAGLRFVAALVALFGVVQTAAAQVALCATDGGCGTQIVINLPPCANCCPLPPNVDAGTPPPPTDGGTPPDAGTPPPIASSGLHTLGNAILRADGTRWMGRGANLADTRSCGACVWEPSNVAEVKRRADAALNAGANFIRLDLESYGTLMEWQVFGLTFTQDANYLNEIVDIVNHISLRPDAYVLVSLWMDPTIGAEGRPTQATADAWKVLAHALRNNDRAMFGVVNEPESNYDGANDAAVWNAMNVVVQAIRAQEAADGAPQHLIAVQGVGGWARRLDYYITHPIPSPNVIYETHVYNPQADFNNLVTTPAATLPVIIGEFGPYEGFMTLSDTAALMTLANSLQVPWAAWTFHQRCPPNLLIDNSNWGCGIGMNLQPTEFALQVKGFLAPASGGVNH